uniref:Secreted protein n=1 Tax=Steinernema glaseri TaxID=37863 RepID=A0A1I7Y4J8_9BILA
MKVLCVAVSLVALVVAQPLKIWPASKYFTYPFQSTEMKPPQPVQQFCSFDTPRQTTGRLINATETTDRGVYLEVLDKLVTRTIDCSLVATLDNDDCTRCCRILFIFLNSQHSFPRLSTLCYVL